MVPSTLQASVCDEQLMSIGGEIALSRNTLNIDMNRILLVKFSGVSFNLNSKRLTSSLSCNVLNPGKIFHSNSIGSPSILSKFLYFEEDFNHPNLCPHASFD